MAKVSTINADCFAVGEAAHILPDNLLVTETRPSMFARFCNEFINSSITWGNKQGLASHRVIVSGLSWICLQKRYPGPWCLEGVPFMLSIVAVEAADSVSCLEIASITQVLLAWIFCCAMSLLTHNLLSSYNRVTWLYHLFLKAYSFLNYIYF